MLCLSINYKECRHGQNARRSLMHCQETSERNQPEGITVLESPACYMIKVKSTEATWDLVKKITGEDYKNCCFEAQERTEGIGFLSNIIENHDEPRGVSRYLPEGEHSPRAKKMLGGLNFLLKGLPFIYQGQEIGMENTFFSSIGEVDDISTLDQYQVALDAGLSPEEALKAVSAYSRDNARTPVQWDDSPQAGFTTGTPWLNVNPNYRRINVAAQEKDEDSVLSF